MNDQPCPCCGHIEIVDDPFYPRILKDRRPDFSKTENEWENKALACADGLEAWAWVMMGNSPPAHFGMTMVRLGEFLGCLATPKGLAEFSKKNILEPCAAKEGENG